MATTVPKLLWEQYFRVAPESAFDTNTATADWNIGGNGGGATGYRDLAVVPGAVRITPNVNNIFTQYAAGKRAMNQQAPVEGAYTVEGTMELVPILELIDPFLEALMGSVSRTPTAGAAAKASGPVAAWSGESLDTEPDGTEQIKIVLASSTGATSASIDIIQSGTTQETITIGSSGSSVDGDYYTKGAYDGSANAITLTTNGTLDGNATVSGIDKNTNVFTLGTSAPSTLKLEEAGQPKSASNSMFYNGVVVPSMTFTFDRAAADGMLGITAPIAARFPSAAAATTWSNDAKNYYYPVQGWTASITKGGASFDKLVAANFTITTNNALFVVSSGNQQPSGAVSGECEVAGTFSVLPEDATEWNLFVGQTVGDYELTFTSPYNIVDSTAFSLLFEFSELYVENYTETAVDQNNASMFGADLAFRTTDDSSDGPVKITSTCRMPI